MGRRLFSPLALFAAVGLLLASCDLFAGPEVWDPAEASLTWVVVPVDRYPFNGAEIPPSDRYPFEAGVERHGYFGVEAPAGLYGSTDSRAYDGLKFYLVGASDDAADRMLTELTFFTEAFDWSDPEGTYRAVPTTQSLSVLERIQYCGGVGCTGVLVLTVDDAADNAITIDRAAGGVTVGDFDDALVVSGDFRVRVVSDSLGLALDVTGTFEHIPVASPSETP
jgi:hypothetical protein